MKWLAIGSSVLVLAVTAGAAVLVQQGGYDLPNVMGWKANSASEAGNQPGTQSVEQSVGRPAETASARQSADLEKQMEAAETAVAALTTPKQPVGSNPRSTFDVARINPDGVSVFAGQGKPFQSVSVLADGVRVGTAKVDENGEWVLVTEKKIASADPELSIEVGTAEVGADPEPAMAPEQIASDGEAAANAEDASGAGSASEEAASPGASHAAARNDVPSPKVREINEKMLSDLQEMVDNAGREETETAAAAPAANQASAERAADTAGSAPAPDATDEAPAVERDEPRKVAAAGTIARAPAAVRAADDEKTIPIPIHFVYREATFTPDGEKAANLLLQYLQLGKLPAVTLSGHADERGSPGLNMELSRNRLKTVEGYLRSGGYAGKFILLPKGETQPFEGVDRASLATDDLFQLDRRVELHLAN